MKKLFVSFTALLRQIASGEVTAGDLAQGLFFFGCTRQHALEPGAQGEYDERTANPEYAQWHLMLVAALRQAEGEGRVAWHRGPEANPDLGPWRSLDNLLVANGFGAVSHPREAAYVADGAMYGYPAVRRLVEQQQLALAVVF